VNRAPKERFTIPKGFQYSQESLLECRRIANRARKILQAKCRQDKAFCVRLNKILRTANEASSR